MNKQKCSYRFRVCAEKLLEEGVKMSLTDVSGIASCSMHKCMLGVVNKREKSFHHQRVELMGEVPLLRYQ